MGVVYTFEGVVFFYFFYSRKGRCGLGLGKLESWGFSGTYFMLGVVRFVFCSLIYRELIDI